MGRRAVPAHYLKHNASERTPKRVLIFDTETTWEETSQERTHRLRLWCAELRDRQPRTRPEKRRQVFDGGSGLELAQLITRLARTNATLWVYAHNLAFDLAVTSLPVHLSALGWELTTHALGADQPWLKMRRGNYHIVIGDSFSLFRLSVEGLGRLLSMDKEPLPGNDACPDVWRARCRRDVEITAAALARLMEWWQSEGCGNWAISGASLGWNLYRHRFTAKGVLIDPDPAARALERSALYAGFGLITQQGMAEGGPFAELDFRHAYLTLAATMPLPIRRCGRFDSLPLDSPWLRGPYRSALAHCRVRTSAPRYPVRIGGQVWHPTGEFWTVLAGPELAAALQRGELLEVGAGWRYLCERSMQAWGKWLCTMLDDATACPYPILYPVLKGWSRSVVGRWAVRVGREAFVYHDPRPGWHIERGRVWGTGEPVALVRLDHRLHEVIQDEDGENAFPAVLAWIQSATRLALADCVEYVGPAIRQANTDGLIVDLEHFRARDWRVWGPDLGNGDPYRGIVDWLGSELSRLVHPLEVRPKRVGPSLYTLTPMHVSFAGERKFAGIPRDAHEVEALTYEFWTWPGLASGMASGEAGTYRQAARRVSLDHVAVAGWKHASGAVEPVYVMPGEDGRPRAALVDGIGDDNGARYRLEEQHAWLRAQFREWTE